MRAPNIVAVATLVKYSDAQRTETREAIAYNLLPEHKIFDWQIGYGGGGLDSGVGLIAIPSLLADLDGTGVTTEVAITNVVPKPGFTDFVIYIYDQNGLLDYICQKLNEKQVEYIDLKSWGYINNGFKGSAIISAVFWEHDVFGERRLLPAEPGRSWRRGGRAVEDVAWVMTIPGDEAAGSRGIPFRQSDIEDAEFEFTFMGEDPAVPGCAAAEAGAWRLHADAGWRVRAHLRSGRGQPERCTARVRVHPRSRTRYRTVDRARKQWRHDTQLGRDRVHDLRGRW